MVIYKVSNTKNEKVYVGITKNFKQRINSHLNNIKKGYNNLKFYREIMKDNITSDLLEFSILEEINSEYHSRESFNRENYWIDYYKNKLGEENLYNELKPKYKEKKILTKTYNYPKCFLDIKDKSLDECTEEELIRFETNINLKMLCCERLGGATGKILKYMFDNFDRDTYILDKSMAGIAKETDTSLSSVIKVFEAFEETGFMKYENNKFIILNDENLL